MAGVMVRADFGKSLWPIVKEWFGRDYNMRETQHTDLFDHNTSRKAFEEDMTYSGFGLAALKTEGGAITYDSASQGFLTRYEMLTYALGFMVSREAFEDDQADIVAPDRARELSASMHQTKEVNASAIYNNAFDSAYTYGDGVEMCSLLHVNKAGGTYANELSTAANLSEAALEQMVIDVAGFTNDRGLQINVMAKSLHIPKELMFEAERILKTINRVGTTDNDISAIVSKGILPGGVKVNNWFTDTNAWFVRTDTRGLKYYERRGLEFGMDNDFDTENAKFKATERYAFGISDPRAIFGSPGA